MLAITSAAGDPGAYRMSLHWIRMNGENRGAMEVAALIQQLEELDQAAQRSVAAEVESAVEAGLVDDTGRARV